MDIWATALSSVELLKVVNVTAFHMISIDNELVTWSLFIPLHNIVVGELYWFHLQSISPSIRLPGEFVSTP